MAEGRKEFITGQAKDLYMEQDGSVIQNEVQEVGLTSNQQNVKTARHADTEDNIQETKQKLSVSNCQDKTDSIEDLGDEWPSYETGSNILPPLIKPKFDGFKKKEACIDSTLKNGEDSLVKANIKPDIKRLNQSVSNNLTHQTANTQGTAYLPVTSDLYSPGCSSWSDFDETYRENDEMTTVNTAAYKTSMDNTFFATSTTPQTTLGNAVANGVLPENTTEIITSATSTRSCTQDTAHLSAPNSRKRTIETCKTQEEHDITSKKIKLDNIQDCVEQQEKPGNSSKQSVCPRIDSNATTGYRREHMCEGCFKFCLADKTVRCQKYHIICEHCLNIEMRRVITTDKMKISCPATLCNGEITLDAASSLQTSVPIETLKDNIHKKQLAASLKTTQQPKERVSMLKCPTAAKVDEKTKIFSCVNGGCQAICRYCKAPWLEKEEQVHAGCSLFKFSGLECLKDISVVPDNWNMYAEPENICQENGYLSVRVPRKSAEGKKICEFYGISSNWHVEKLRRIQNQSLWEKYALKRKHMKEEIGEEELREKFLFHGTSKENVDKICREGFDFRKLSANGTRYGKGNYFSTTAHYSERFLKDSLSLFLVRVLCGRSTKGHPDNTHPPYETSGRMFDSCVDDPSKPSMYIVYSIEQCYPAYIITFKREMNM